jgi:hypothetical protein
MIEVHGGFVLLSLATPLDVYESRDFEGLCAKALGIAPQFAEISGLRRVRTRPRSFGHDRLTPEQIAQ